MSPTSKGGEIDAAALVARTVEVRRIRGVPLRIDRRGLATLLGVNGALVLLLCRLARPDLPIGKALAVAAAASVLLMISAALHELAHLAFARRAGQAVGGIVLSHFGACILVDQGDADALDLGSTALYVAAGPALTLALWLGLAGLAEITRSFSGTLTLTLGLASALNLALLALNLMPLEPLDGGRLLRCAAVAWRRRGASIVVVEGA